ncbi:hypothetical protein XENOCAPTIV_004149 [Xenoophorus captivus]|uniref:Formin FH3 domain-containing protein n=1 Tax=Xenoophorus captivus TaxID=1517983 RepID=A0ABV0QUS3_9TELE
MQFINIVVHSVENMNFRVHLQYEFTHLGLDKYLESVKQTESEKLKVQIQAYLDNVLDVGALLEDAENRGGVLDHVDELQNHNVQESLRESCSQVRFKTKKPIQTKYRMPLLNWQPLKPNQVTGTVFNELDDEQILVDIRSLERGMEMTKKEFLGPMMPKMDLIAELKKRQVKSPVREGKDGALEDIITEDKVKEPRGVGEEGERDGVGVVGEEEDVGVEDRLLGREDDALCSRRRRRWRRAEDRSRASVHRPEADRFAKRAFAWLEETVREGTVPSWGDILKPGAKAAAGEGIRPKKMLAFSPDRYGSVVPALLIPKALE